MCTMTKDIMDVDYCISQATISGCAVTCILDYGNQFEMTFVGSYADLFFLRLNMLRGGFTSFKDLEDLDNIAPIRVLEVPEIEKM